MNQDKSKYRCRVCGFLQDELPWGESEDLPTFNICPCCGVEFGYEDATLYGIRRYRKLWLSGGAKWFNPKLQPKDWTLELQLKGIPTRYV